MVCQNKIAKKTLKKQLSHYTTPLMKDCDFTNLINTKRYTWTGMQSGTFYIAFLLFSIFHKATSNGAKFYQRTSSEDEFVKDGK